MDTTVVRLVASIGAGLVLVSSIIGILSVPTFTDRREGDIKRTFRVAIVGSLMIVVCALFKWYVISTILTIPLLVYVGYQLISIYHKVPMDITWNMTITVAGFVVLGVLSIAPFFH